MTNKYGEDKVIEDSFINDYKRALMKEVEMNPKWGSSAKEIYYFMITYNYVYYLYMKLIFSIYLTK